MTTGGESTFVTLYEELRCHMLEGSAAVGNHFGLVLLLRDGVVAWMRGVVAPSTAARPVASSQQPRPPLSDEINASIVAVLANMALSGPKEEMRYEN